MDLGKKRGCKTLHGGDRIGTYFTSVNGRINKYRYTRSHLMAGSSLVTNRGFHGDFDGGLLWKV